ncbi:MAG: diguanylate cyclase domain protein [Alphaproteobacteria bacterium]|nr:diguanylate cyclase domain protein [Alphaproteobacteria bacterium]
MQTPEQQNRIAHVAQQVMHRISEDSLKPNPAVYAVLYAHYAGMEPDVSKQILLLEKQNQSLTTTICEDLHDKFMSNDHEKLLIHETTQKVEEAVAEIVEVINAAGLASKQFSQKLQAHSSNASGTQTLSDIKKLISELVTDTKRMLEENKKLEEKLNDSSQELQQMRNSVHNLQQ